MAFLAPLALLALLAASPQSASAFGTLLALFPSPNLKGDKDVAWIVPDPVSGCSAVPPGLSPKSGKIWWDSKDGTAACASLLFYPTANCAGSPAVTIPQAPQPKKGGLWVTESKDYSKSDYSVIGSAKSVSCSLQQESASTGTAPGASLPEVSAVSGPDLWMVSLNSVRSQGNTIANPLKWDPQLASRAQWWTDKSSKAQCGADMVILRKIPSSGFSESDVWISFSDKEGDAVAAWAPDPKDDSNPRTARILDSSAERVGCGKTSCGQGAFFTCLFAPITF